MTKGLMSLFFNTPILHHSKAEAFKNFWQPLNYFFIGYDSEKNKVRRPMNDTNKVIIRCTGCGAANRIPADRIGMAA